MSAHFSNHWHPIEIFHVDERALDLTTGGAYWPNVIIFTLCAMSTGGYFLWKSTPPSAYAVINILLSDVCLQHHNLGWFYGGLARYVEFSLFDSMTNWPPKKHGFFGWVGGLWTHHNQLLGVIKKWYREDTRLQYTLFSAWRMGTHNGMNKLHPSHWNSSFYVVSSCQSYT